MFYRPKLPKVQPVRYFRSTETQEASTEALRDERGTKHKPDVTIHTQETKRFGSESVKPAAGQLLEVFMNTAHNSLDRNSLHTVLIHNIKGLKVLHSS